MDPYLKVITQFNRNKISYVVIGAGGINYYAEDTSQIIMTADYDIFLNPEVKNVLNAIKIIQSLDYAVFVKGKEIKEFTEKAVKKIVAKRETISCENFYHNLIELILEVSGYSFAEVEKNAKNFKANQIKIKVASLYELLNMKRIAGREKDKIFLKKYSGVLKDF